jgi:parallel beta-helix repeat protein
LKRTVSGIMLTLLLMSMLTLAFNAQPVKASGTTYIRADGSIDPPTAKITSADNITYTFTDNIYDSIVVERDNIFVDGLGYAVQGTGSGRGIDLTRRSNVTINNMGIKTFIYGVYLSQSSNNTVSGNNITNNDFAGIRISDSSNNSVVGNNITDNLNGILLYYSYNNIIAENNMKHNNYEGIDLQGSSSNTISGNTVTNNQYGIFFSESSSNVLRDNAVASTRWSFRVLGSALSHYVNDVDVSNTVDGKPVYYWVNKQDMTVPLDAGYVALTNCTRITVRNLTLTKNGQGVLLAYTNDSQIANNTVTNNEYGIKLQSSSDNSVVGNNVTSNGYGVYLSYSSENKFYHNNFMDNTQQVYILGSGRANFWDDSHPSGGNFWSNYTGVDLFSGLYQNETGSDGFGDVAHGIDASNTDNYPLMKPYHGPVRNLNTGQSYPTIQGAINNASEGDTMLALSGTYYEHVVVNTTISLIGENKSNTIIDGNETGNVVTITANNVNFTGFTVRNSGSPWSYASGIYIGSSSDSNISNNIITSSNYGIMFESSNHNTLSGNNITNNDYYGIMLRDSYSNKITKNTITANDDDGIRVYYYSQNNTIANNTITNNEEGIHLWYYSQNNTIANNMITANNGYGVFLLDSSNNNTIANNMITANNGYGVGIGDAYNSKITNNTITNNDGGIRVHGSSNNTFYHNNLIGNANQVYCSDSVNVWDDGYPCGGNYWSDYAGVDLYSGHYQNKTGGDGIGDTPYVIDANNTDHYPLMNPWPDTTPPMINILSPQNTTYTTGSVPLTFTVNEATSWIGYSLDNHANVPITGNTTLTGLTLGPHNVIVYANDIHGNTGSSNKVYFIRIVNDVAILNVTVSPTETYVKQIVNINVTVENKGTVSETFNITAYYDSDPIGTQSVVNLAPSSNITMTFSWNTSGVQKGTYTISAEAEVVLGESNTSDNTYIDNTVTILNSPPVIDSFTPVDTTPELNEGSSLEFTHASSDPNGDSLTYSWLLNSVEQSTGQNWTYLPGYDDAGTHNITLIVSDGVLFNSQEWNVTVADINRPPTIDSYFPLTDSTISEGESQEFNVTYSDPDGDSTTVQWYLDGMPTVTTDFYTFIADYASAGIYNLTVVVSDGASQVSQQWTLMVTNVERDVGIITVTPSKNIVGEGYCVSINVTITNQGELAETFNVTVYVKTTIIATFTNITLTSGNYTTITSTWDTADFALGDYTLSAVADTVPGETNTTDNTYIDSIVTITIPGDVDGDFDVDIYDVVKMCGCYGAEEGDPEYIAECDVDGDGDVDIYDIVIMCNHYGEVYS